MTTAGLSSVRPFSRQSLHPVLWITLILLATAAFRLVALSAVPPGMTHDEADHGITAWSIVNGARDIYFTIGYGREPLYDYATALIMAATGPTILAARLTAVYFSLLLVAGTYAWTRLAFDRSTALLTAAGLAVGFWPVMAGRQALRSITLPALFVLAVFFFWRGLQQVSQNHRRRLVAPFAASGLLLGLCFYTYIPARVLWLLLPAVVVYLAFTPSPRARTLRATGEGLALTLIVAAFAAAPLFFFLLNNPGLEVRIDELSAPLRAAAAGDFGPLWANASSSLRLFTSKGDPTWRYNLPGKPFLAPLMGLLFYGGLAVAFWFALRGLAARENPAQTRFLRANFGPGAFAAWVWLVLGFAPVLVTGPALSMTQAIGVLPVLYLFPAMTLTALYAVARSRVPDGRRKQLAVAAGTAAAVLYCAIGALTARDYFDRWANAPEVRVQYETTLVTALRYLEAQGADSAAVSTITPGRYHSPAVAAMTLHDPAITPRWFDARGSLLLPDESTALVVIPGFTPLPAALQPYLATGQLIHELPLRPEDLDRPVKVYAVDSRVAIAAAMARMATQTGDTPLPMNFGEHLALLGYDLASNRVRPGDTLTLVTAWRLDKPLEDAVLFAHVGEGEPLTQSDRLDAPGESWRAGDVLLQLHEIVIPADARPGDYPLRVGVYTPGGRLMIDDAVPADSLLLATVSIVDE